MKRHHVFKLSLLSLSLLQGFAYAQDVAPSKKLTTIQVTAGADTATRRITTAKMDENTNTSLKEVLAQEPSISMGGGNGTSQFLYIRGMGQNSVDVKLDNAYSDSQILYHQGRHMLDPALVKIISVQKGAGSASAGIGQTNGAIVAKTVDAHDLLKNSSNPNIGAKINAGYNSNDGHNYGLSVFGKNDTIDFLIAANRVNDNAYKGGNNYRNSFGKKEVPYSALDKTSYLAKIGATFGDHRFVLSHLNTKHEGTRLVREEFTTDPIGTPNSRITLDRQAPSKRKMGINNTSLEWTGKNLGFAQSANANIYRLVNSRWSADDAGNGYAGNSQGTTQNKIETIGANVSFNSQVHDKVLLKYGINYRLQEVKPHTFFKAGLVNQKKQDIGAYVEAISDITEQLTLTTGLRYDHFNFKAMDSKKHSDGAINPSVAINYQVTPEFSLKAHHNYATRSPRLHDALMAHGNRGIISISDETKAEQARNTEISFRYDRSNYGFEGTYFWQNIKDALGTSNGRHNHGKNDQDIINAGKIKNKGYELSAYYRYDNFTARIGVAHAKPRFTAPTVWVKDRGKQVEKSLLSGNPEYASAIGRTWTASLAYRFAQPNLELAVQHRQVENVKPEDNYFISGGTLQTNPGKGKAGYGVTDITANWKPFNNDKMNVNFAINNLGNKLYYAHAQRGAFPGAGRQYRVSVNYTF